MRKLRTMESNKSVIKEGKPAQKMIEPSSKNSLKEKRPLRDRFECFHNGIILIVI
jgi:hypothetical protein